MINPTASMKMGERYSVEQIGDTHPITRFFLDGKYFLRPERLSAVGWFEGQKIV